MNTRLFSCALGALLLPSLALALDPPPGGSYPGETTALGQDALFSLTDFRVSSNTAIGYQALYANTGGGQCTAVGDSALHDNTNGDDNTALGWASLQANTTGSGNTAAGAGALRYNTTAIDNTAVGDGALGVSNGYGNTAVGSDALAFNTTGEWNTAVGDIALAFNSTGSFNVGLGRAALNQVTTGQYNIGIGGQGGTKLTSGSYNIDIGNVGVRSDDRTIRIGSPKSQRSTYIAGITGVTVAGGVEVVIDDQGHLGTLTSSARYKREIQPMDKSSEAILSLQPVTFRYKEELDPQAIPQFGLVAEQVAKVAPELVARDESGQPYTVRYEAVNAMLLNEFLKEHRQVEEQSATVEAQGKTIESLQRRLSAQAAEQKGALDALSAIVKAQSEQLQKVSAQWQSKQDAPRLVSAGE